MLNFTVLAITTTSVDDIYQADIDSSTQIRETPRSQRLGYEEMHEHELWSEGSYVRLNRVETTARQLPYVNVTLEEMSSETLTSRSDRPHQYLTVVIEDAEHMVTDDMHQPDADSSAHMEEPHRSQRLGYEDMQQHESSSGGSCIRLNSAGTTARSLPYVNVTMAEGSSETLASGSDRSQQYLNVVIEDAECLVSDCIHQADAAPMSEIVEPQRSERFGYEEMQEYESPSESANVRLNPPDTTTRPLPYVNVTLQESCSETLEYKHDKPQQYLNVVIENSECLVSDGDTRPTKMQSYVNVSLQNN